MYSIGMAASKSGVKVPTIRYYESIGLVPTPARQTNNRRQYDGHAINRLVFIRRARELGFAIIDIGALLKLAEMPEQPCLEADQIARTQLRKIEKRILELKSLETELKRMIVKCARRNPSKSVADCCVLGEIGDA